MAFTPKKYAPRLNAEALRRRKLDLTAKAAAWWLLALGILNLLMNDRLALALHMRYTYEAVPVISSLGLAYLLLGLYLRRSLSEPENQYLSVDLLLLFFWVQLVIVMKNKVYGRQIFAGEWLIFAVDLAFGVCLYLFRTDSSKMAAGAPEAKDAKIAARETILRLKDLLKEGKRVNPLPGPEDAVGPDGERKKVSEAAPHMD
jgi:hypothetical protein